VSGLRDLKNFLLGRQRRRNVDVAQVWWRLPDDPTRTSSAWRQLVVDLFAPATFSQWHAKVVKDRVALYDRLRMPITRAVSLTVIITVVVVLGTPWWLMAATLWAAVPQVLLEIYLEPYALKPDVASRLSWTNRMAELVRDNQPSTLVNVTGVLGFFACMLNVVAVAFAPSGGDLGWLKIAALAAAVVYGNSCLGNFFMDPANYTERSTMPPFVHAIRPYASMIALTFVATVVWLSVKTAHWEPALIPVAFLCSLETLQLGATIRNHDRMLAAAIPTGREAISTARWDITDYAHTEMNRVKQPIFQLQDIETVPLALSAIPAIVTHLYDYARTPNTSKLLPLDELVAKILHEYDRMDTASIRFELGWNGVNERHQHAAERVLSALCLNVAQALSKDEFAHISTDLTVEARVIRTDTDAEYLVAVHDNLPKIDDFCPPRTTSLTSLRNMLRDDFDGDLRQEPSQYAAKAIVATWSDRAPAIKVGEPFGGLTHADEMVDL